MVSLAEAVVLAKPVAAQPVAAQSGMCVFSVDVEDWFHILDVPSAPSFSAWHSLPSRVEKNFYRLLDIFSLKGVRVTCFFLGWVAERYPQLVREAVRRKHEIGSHGYSHQLLYRMTREEFREDALFSRVLLEDISGTSVVAIDPLGFRRREQRLGFSMNSRPP